MMVHTFHTTFVSPNENYFSTQQMTQSDNEVVTMTFYIYIGTLLRHSLTIIQRFDFYWLRIKDEIKENKDRQKKYIIIHKIYKCRIKMRRKEKYVSNL